MQEGFIKVSVAAVAITNGADKTIENSRVEQVFEKKELGDLVVDRASTVKDMRDRIFEKFISGADLP